MAQWGGTLYQGDPAENMSLAPTSPTQTTVASTSGRPRTLWGSCWSAAMPAGAADASSTADISGCVQNPGSFVCKWTAGGPVGGRICTVQILGLGIALPPVPPGQAAAQPLPPENQRTVEWYASHPSERAQVRRICLNDPGHLAMSPDCINAKRGDLSAAAGKVGGSSRSNSDVDVSDPETPEYWTRRPGDRAFKLAYCARMTPEAAARATCGPAQQSLHLEQRGNSRR